LYKELRKHLGEVFRRLAEQKESKIEEGHLQPDHVHMMLSIPPKYAVSQVIRYQRKERNTFGAGIRRA
jgi:putative transposase